MVFVRRYRILHCNIISNRDVNTSELDFFKKYSYFTAIGTSAVMTIQTSGTN